MTKPLVTPIARAVAKRLGVDLNLITQGSGPNNRITKDDVIAFSQKQMSSSTTVTTQAPTPEVVTTTTATTTSTVSNQSSTLETKRVKITPIRKAIAKAMINSRDNVAYFSLVNEIDVTKLWNLRKEIVEDVQKTTGVKLTFLPFIAKAILIALKEFPIMAAKYDEAANEIVYPATLNLGIAVDTETGLMVPVVKDAQTLSMTALAAEISRLALAARNKTIKVTEMQNGSFTITNYGSVGALFGTPVINYPELAIAGVGAIVDRVVFNKQGEVKPAKVMNITISADHRWIDGADAGRFIARVKELLEKPEVLGVL
ncbi:2-oxo acid dehydrogenase subunit E2 [Mesomycoplasma neurolyticum]|uniref:Branched-chain alpha-keto acid dehydrogenase subunit E2 n=1 Tax=Mesomycoplasma neurolyticum TaxID=2120 RepID=A0A449A477_9BACT|nr:2-oxo acid dehydrogenase subunit E2 [Mesomycoplasma neurolyticum]VEU59055.1 branched-chain alpha-keto acid dehydrogenase subunit E2 [Mesomycoplasma neurolyticum]